MLAPTSDSQPASLPITRDLTLAYALSLVVALLPTIPSAASLLYQAHIYPGCHNQIRTATATSQTCG
jgi:hypothetical protein